MSSFKKLKFALIGTVSLFHLGIATAQASPVTSVTVYDDYSNKTQLMDNYVGADGNTVSYKDYTPISNDNYNTHWLAVERVLSGPNNEYAQLNVTVHSNFVSYNEDSRYKFGDLFLMDGNNYEMADTCDDGSGRVGCNEYTEVASGETVSGATVKSNNNWEYAFDLGGDRKYSSDNLESGKLRAIDADDQDRYEYSVNSTGDNRDWQAIYVKNPDGDRSTTTVGSGGKWKTDTSNDFLMMSFDITGTTLASANQIALRWAMTCANDIIEAVAHFRPSKPGTNTAVSEPGTLMLLLLSAFGLFATRKKFNKQR